MEETVYYVLFKNYTQGMALQDMLRGEGIPSRISPAPRDIQGDLGCGMSVLISADNIEAAREAIGRHDCVYHAIVETTNRIKSNRHRFC